MLTFFVPFQDEIAESPREVSAAEYKMRRRKKLKVINDLLEDKSPGHKGRIVEYIGKSNQIRECCAFRFDLNAVVRSLG